MNIKERFLDIATILLLYTVATMLIFGFIDAISGTLMPYEFTYLGQTESSIIAFDPEVWEIFSGYIRIVGYTFISFGVILVIVILFGFRKKEKWAWIVAIWGSLSLDIPFLIILATTMNLPFYLILTNLIVQVVALGISFKEFFGAK